MKRNSYFDQVLMLIFLVMGGVAYATTLTHTVCESGCDFTNQEGAAAHLAATHSNLISADVNAVVSIVNSWSAPDTTAVSYAGIATDATHTLTVQTVGAARHDGTISKSGAYRLETTTGEYSPNTSITVNGISYITIDGLVIKTNGAKGDSTFHGIFSDLSNATIKNTIMYTTTTDRYAAGGDGILCATSGTAVTCSVYNNIAFGWKTASGTKANGIRVSPGEYRNIAGNVYNNTAYGSDVGIKTDAGSSGGVATYIVKNNLSIGDTTADYSLAGDSLTTSNNGSSDTTGNVGLQSLTAANLFTSIAGGSENFHLKAGAAAIDVGTDLSAVFTTDIDGDTRPQGLVFDVGADEYSSGGGATTGHYCFENARINNFKVYK